MENFRETTQQEAINALLSVDYGAINVSARLGKTLIGLSIASKFKKVLVSYPFESILQSWLEDAKKFNIPIENITFTTHLSLNKHNLEDFEVLITDEIHDLSINQLDYIVWNLPNKWYGLTATYPNSGEKKKILQESCPIVYEKTLDETTGKTNKDYQIIVHLLEPSKIANISLKSGKMWSEEAKIRFWDNKYKGSRNFMDLLKVIQNIQNSRTKLDYLKELSNKIDRCLIFLETQKQCEELGFDSYHSNERQSGEYLEAFQSGLSNKLACIKQLSSGISFKNLNKAIILHCYASNNKFHQRCARVLNMIDNVEKEAEIHLLCLKNTRDEEWVKKGLAEFDQSKITYKTIK